MGLAFWRGRESQRTPSSRPPSDAMPDGTARTDPAAALRVRARRRLVGAAALLLGVVVVVPMILDPTPRPVPDSIPIDIPSEKAPFTPRLPLPPLPEPATPAVDSARPEGAPAVVQEPVDARPPGAAADGKAEPKMADAGRPAVQAPAQAHADAGKEAKFAVQAGAFSSDKAARELTERLKKGGFAAYTERIDTRDGARYRVRVGPYATKEDAERARARLGILGVSANVVEP
jgi:DedD protein